MRLLFLITVTFSFFVETLQAQPVSLRSDITVTEVLQLPSNTVRIARDPSEGTVYIARTNGEIHSVDLENGTRTRIQTSSDHGLTNVTGFTIASDGTFFMVSAESQGGSHVGVVKRGTLDGATRVWSTLAQTEPYQSSGLRDHLFNAIAVTPDGQFVIVNSGSRTDHGEMGNGGREFPITSAFFKLPIDDEDIILENDEAALAPYLFADGLRNSYDMAFSPAGDLFATENCGARDDPEELNWVREGHHYGFPWRLALEDNPQQFPDFDPPDSDPLIVDGINMERTFYNDPTFPAKPDGLEFTDPVINVGPDADHFRDTDAVVKDASDEGGMLGTFTPHSSPLALVFDHENLVTDEFAGDCFVVSYNDASLKKYAPFGDPGEDLLHVELTKITAEDRYEARVSRLVQGFDQPVDALMLGNHIFVLEYGNGSLWRVTLPAKTTSVTGTPEAQPESFTLLQNYPNPFNPGTTIRFQLTRSAKIALRILDVTGSEITTLANGAFAQGDHSIEWNGRDGSGQQVASGLYFYRLQAANGLVQTRKMILMK